MEALAGTSESPFSVITDHKNLEYLRNAKRLNARQARWSLFFSRFRFSITYRPGSCNTKADALSHLHQKESTPSETEQQERIQPPEVIISSIRWEIDEEIKCANSALEIPTQCPPEKLYVP